MNTNSFSKTINNVVLFLLIVFFIFNVIETAQLFHSQYLYWTVEYGLIVSILVKLFYEKRHLTFHNVLFFLYFAWLISAVIRGVYVAENYWEVKFLTNNPLCLSIPIFALLFYQPSFTLSFFQKWSVWIIVMLVLFTFNILPRGWIHNMIGPVYLLMGSFLFIIPSWKWRIIVALYLLLMLSNLEDRSQVLKALMAIAISLAMLLNRWIPRQVIQVFCIGCYVAAISLLYLGITGRYNVFDHSDHDLKDTYVNGKLVNKEKSAVYSDTRTAIYFEVIYSALYHDYIWTGRTPARGNDTVLYKIFGDKNMSDEAKQERNMNELCHLNVFTWLGLIGVILYSLLYLEASILGAFFSNNCYIRYLAALVSFHWLFGWVEDINNFNFMNIGLWMLAGMCISPYFRKMSDLEFKLWFQSIFSDKIITSYHKYNLLKLYLASKLNSQKQNR